MTAEVAILNRSAVAIAADSAVTISSSASKIYNTANKLFPLSTVDPVAVMVYGSASIGEIPWETAVKEFRRTLASTSYGTVDEYAEAFICYLTSLVPHMFEEEQDERISMIASWEFGLLRDVISRDIENSKKEGYSHEEAIGQAKVTLYNEIKDRIQVLKNFDCYDDFTISDEILENNTLIHDFPAFEHELFEGQPILEDLKRLVRELVHTSFMAKQSTPWSSGIVITGFGKEQLFSALSHYRVDGVINGKIRTLHLEDCNIGRELSAVVRSFAQADMVTTFMDGIHPDYRQALDWFINDTIELLINHFGKQVKELISEVDFETLLDKMTTFKENIVEHFQDTLYNYLGNYNSDPIMEMVQFLPKEELAEMAEALVNLTSFKRRVTPEAETVGGPIDVAVISKGDGLVWIKRKHYFSPELNHRYLYRDR